MRGRLFFFFSRFFFPFYMLNEGTVALFFFPPWSTLYTRNTDIIPSSSLIFSVCFHDAYLPALFFFFLLLLFFFLYLKL